MTTLRNRLFLEGILLGGVGGLVIGSLIAFQISGNRVNALRRVVVELMVGEREPSRRYNLQ